MTAARGKTRLNVDMLLFLLRLLLIYLGVILGVRLIRTAVAAYRDPRPRGRVRGGGRSSKPLPEDEIVDAKWEEIDQ